MDFAKNVTLRGHEFVKNEQGRQNQNRIQSSDWLFKDVVIIYGQHKGMKGRVTAVNGQLAELESSMIKKKLFIEVHHIRDASLPSLVDP